MTRDKNSTERIRSFFDGLADGWDARCRHDPEKLAAIVTLAGIGPGSRVADIACGTGVLFPEILSRKPSLLFGIDLSEKMIEKAREKFSDPRLRLAAADCFDVKETGFDVVVLYSALPHFSDRARLAAQAAAMLKPGGRFLAAHSEGRQSINSCHDGGALTVSWELKSAREEAANFAGLFAIDMLADTKDIYFFSGTKKESAAGKMNSDSEERGVKNA